MPVPGSEFIAWMLAQTLLTVQLCLASGKGNHFNGEQLQVSPVSRFSAFELVKSPSLEVTKS